MAHQKANVVIADTDVNNPGSVAERSESETKTEIIPYQVDVNREKSNVKLKQEVLRKHSVIDMLVNAQGVSVKQPSVEIMF